MKPNRIERKKGAAIAAFFFALAIAFATPTARRHTRASTSTFLTDTGI